MVKHNNMVHNVHLHMHWQGYVKTWFTQAARKKRRLVARQEKAARLFPRPVSKLRSLVRCPTRRYNGKLRVGRGFTLEETKKAGLTPVFARSIGICVDHRRQNTSVEQLQMNVERLKQYLNKLILFPRKENKPKKGIVDDSTKDQLSAVQEQDKSKKFMDLLPTTTKENKISITPQMKDFKAYQTIRKLKTDKKYHGKTNP